MKKLYIVLILSVIASVVSIPQVYAYETDTSQILVSNQTLYSDIAVYKELDEDPDFVPIENPFFLEETTDSNGGKTEVFDPVFTEEMSVNEGEENSEDTGLNNIVITPMNDWWGYPDQYEGNNSFSNATDRSIGNPSALVSGIKTTYATIHKEAWYVGGATDDDYYRFDVYADAQLQINLINVPSNVDYDLELYQFPDTPYPVWSDVTRIGQSKAGTDGQNETIVRTVTPATYFVRVMPYQSDDWNEDQEYKLQVTQLLASRSAISISDLRNAGAKAAIWQSDISPFGYTSFDLDDQIEVGFRVSNDYYYYDYYQTPFHDKLKSYATNNQVVNSVVYVWNVQWRIKIYQILGQIATKLEQEVANQQQVRLQFEYTSNGINIIGTALGSIPNLWTEIIGVILTSGTEAAGYLVPSLFPEVWSTYKEDMLNYIYILMAAFEADQNTSPNEVVHVKVRYEYYSHYDFLIGQTTYYVRIAPQVSQTSYLYSNATISHWQSGGYSQGLVYGIRNYTDFNKFRNGTLTPGIPSTGGGGGGGGGGRGPIVIVPNSTPITSIEE